MIIRWLLGSCFVDVILVECLTQKYFTITRTFRKWNFNTLVSMGNRMVTSQLQTVARWSQTDTGYDVRIGNLCEKDMFHQRAFFTVFTCYQRSVMYIITTMLSRNGRNSDVISYRCDDPVHPIVK